MPLKDDIDDVLAAWLAVKHAPTAIIATADNAAILGAEFRGLPVLIVGGIPSGWDVVTSEMRP